MAVEWPDRRADVVNGLDTLAADPVLNSEGRDQRWPDLTNAAHWLVDDTWWDQAEPAESIGSLLVDTSEAEAVAAICTLIVAVSERVGATATDAAWCSDPAWPQVQEAARNAAALLKGNNK